MKNYSQANLTARRTTFRLRSTFSHFTQEMRDFFQAVLGLGSPATVAITIEEPIVRDLSLPSPH